MSTRSSRWRIGAVLVALTAASLPLLSAPAGAADAVVVEGFEGGLPATATTSGDVGVVAAEGPIAPVEGASMLRLSTGGAAVGDQQSSVQWSVPIPPQIAATGITVSARYNFVSEEYPEFVNSAYNDTATLDLQLGNGTTVNLFTRSVNNASFTPVGIDYPGGDGTTGQTGWLTASLTLTPDQLANAAGGVLVVRDFADTAYDTVLLVDDVRVYYGTDNVVCPDGRTLSPADVESNVQILRSKLDIDATEEATYRADPCLQVTVEGDVGFETGEGQEVAGIETAETAGDGAPTGSDGTYRVRWAWNWKLTLTSDVKARADWLGRERVITPAGGVIGAVAASYEYDMIKKDGAWDGFVYNVSRQSLRSFDADLEGLETQLRWTGPAASNSPPAGYGGAGSTDNRGRTWRTQFSARVEVSFGAGVGPLAANASFVVTQLEDTAEVIFFGDEPRARVVPTPFELEQNTYSRYSSSTTPPQ